MNRLTKRTQKGAALKLDNPKTEKEAIKQLHDKYLLAIEKLAAYEDTGITPEEIMDGKMPTGWIPCIAREPDEAGWYLTTSALQFNCRDVDIKHYSKTRGWKVRPDEFFVLAWQPLPEPWEGEIDEIH